MNFQNSLTRAYAGIITIPLAAVLFASAISGGGDSYGAPGNTGGNSSSSSSGVTLDADAYESLGKYNPCIFIACDGE